HQSRQVAVDVEDGVEAVAAQACQSSVPVPNDALQLGQNVRLGAAVEQRDVVARLTGSPRQVSAYELGAAEDEQTHRHSPSRSPCRAAGLVQMLPTPSAVATSPPRLAQSKPTRQLSRRMSSCEV